MVRIARPNPATLFGKGTVAEIASVVEAAKPSVVIVNHSLSPIQQRNLEKEWQAKVIDRTGLILEIFGARAQTREGQIQVTLAQLEYQKSRLVRSWTHLERQRGGLGKTGGPGETQLEIDRRLIVDRIAQLKRDLEQVRQNRELQRKSREKVPFPVVAIVGYTNAGKSTLFNRLTGANVFAEDLPFATLDPTMRKIALGNGQDVILSDTVGFIADLPTHLVAAFRATLEQVQYADVILHVRDASNPASDAQREDVIAILHDLGIDYERDPRIVEVLNKLDAINDPEQQRAIEAHVRFAEKTVGVSAIKGTGVDDLLKAVAGIVSSRRRLVDFRLPVQAGNALAWLYAHGDVLQRRDEGDMVDVSVSIEPADLGRFHERFGFTDRIVGNDAGKESRP